MHVEADDTIKNVAIRHIDRHVIGKAFENLGHSVEPIAQQQDLLGRKSPARRMRFGKHAQHDRAFGDEAVLPASQVAFANIAKFRSPRILGTFDRVRYRGHTGLSCPTA